MWWYKGSGLQMKQFCKKKQVSSVSRLSSDKSLTWKADFGLIALCGHRDCLHGQGYVNTDAQDREHWTHVHSSMWPVVGDWLSACNPEISLHVCGWRLGWYWQLYNKLMSLRRSCRKNTTLYRGKLKSNFFAGDRWWDLFCLSELPSLGRIWQVCQLCVSATCLHTTAFLLPAPSSVGGEEPLDGACSCHNCLHCDKLHVLLLSVSSGFT